MDSLFTIFQISEIHDIAGTRFHDKIGKVKRRAYGAVSLFVVQIPHNTFQDIERITRIRTSIFSPAAWEASDNVI
jgi:hypothetical protein